MSRDKHHQRRLTFVFADIAERNFFNSGLISGEFEPRSRPNDAENGRGEGRPLRDTDFLHANRFGEGISNSRGW